MSALQKRIAVLSPSSRRSGSPAPGSFRSGSPPPGSSRSPSSLAASQSRPAPSEKPAGVTRLPRKSYAAEPDSDADEDISGSESEDEWVGDVNDIQEFEDDLEDEIEEEIAPVKNRKTLEREKPGEDTDDEDEDDEITRADRRSVKYDLRQEIGALLAKDVLVDSAVWTPDEKDEDLLRRFIVAPVCKQGSNWMKFNKKEQDNVRQAVMEGTALGKKLSIIAETPRLYLAGFKMFMGLYQNELGATFPESLVDGKLHLWQFFTFKVAHSMEVPQGIDHLLEKVESPGMRTHAFCGFRQLCQSLMKFLATSEAKSMFLRRTRVEYEMDDEDLKAEARVQREQEMTHIKSTLDLLGVGKPFGSFKKEREGLAEDRAEFRSTFEGYEVPDASIAIPKYLGHELTRAFFVEMVDLATRKVVLSPNKMVQLTKHFVKIIHLKNGHRVEVFKKFTRGMWLDAVTKGAARYPYQKVEDETTTDKIWTDEEGKKFKVLEDPHKMDMSKATKEEIEEWDLLSGIAARIDQHKTGSTYPLYFWFSQFDQVSL
jgi:hypothetical protein